MREPWTTPDFTEIPVHGECTAYSGAADAPASRPRPPGGQAEAGEGPAAGGEVLSPDD
jgi:hypothetical protein